MTCLNGHTYTFQDYKVILIKNRLRSSPEILSHACSHRRMYSGPAHVVCGPATSPVEEPRCFKHMYVELDACAPPSSRGCLLYPGVRASWQHGDEHTPHLGGFGSRPRRLSTQGMRASRDVRGLTSRCRLLRRGRHVLSAL